MVLVYLHYSSMYPFIQARTRFPEPLLLVCTINLFAFEQAMELYKTDYLLYTALIVGDKLALF